MYEYFFLQLDIRYGEYEFISANVHQVPVETSIYEFSETYAKEFYTTEMEEDNGTYYFDADAVAVKVFRQEKISEQEYDVLRKYI